MDFAAHLVFIAGFVLLGCMSPGPNMMVVTSHAIASRRAGVFAAMGVAAAGFSWALIGVAGLAIVLARVSWLYEAVRIVGAAYLIWLGSRLLWGLRRASGPGAAGVPRPASDGVAWRRGYLTSMTNPKALAFAAGFYPAVLPATAPGEVYVATVLVVTTVSIGWHLALAVALSTRRVERAFARFRRVLDAIMGAMLVALGARLAIER